MYYDDIKGKMIFTPWKKYLWQERELEWKRNRGMLKQKKSSCDEVSRDTVDGSQIKNVKEKADSAKEVNKDLNAHSDQNILSEVTYNKKESTVTMLNVNVIEKMKDLMKKIVHS